MSELGEHLLTDKIERTLGTRPGGTWRLLKVCFDALAFLSATWDAADMKGRSVFHIILTFMSTCICMYVADWVSSCPCPESIMSSTFIAVHNGACLKSLNQTNIL